MRMIVLSALFALGLGLAGSTGASAASIGAGINQAANASSLVEQTALICRRIRVCHRVGPLRVRGCRVERVCREFW
jgi:hypothetical protein